MLRYGGHHWHDRARPLWTFRRLLVPFHVPCWQVDHWRDLELFLSRSSSIINHQSSSHKQKSQWFCSQKKATLDRAKEPQVFRCAMHHWGQDSVFFCRWPAKNVSNQLIVSVDLINLYQFCLFVSIHFHSGYLSCIFFSISGEGPKTFPTVPDCPFDSDHEHFPWNLQQQQEVSQVPKVVIFGAIHVDLCRD